MKPWVWIGLVFLSGMAAGLALKKTAEARRSAALPGQSDGAANPVTVH